MAAVDTGNNPNDPNNPNNAPGAVSQPGQTNQPATTSGAGGVTATGAGNVTGQVVGTANPSQPFQNISSYLAANAPGGQQLAGQVAGAVAAPINEAKTGITNAAQDFSKSVNAGYAPENKDLITAVSSNPAYVAAENPENISNFLGQLNNKYTGPTDFSQAPGYGDIQSKIASAQSAAANTENESGIQSLLKGVEGPTTAGINKLDSLLLSTDPSNYKTIKDAGTGASQLLPTLNQTTTDQNALAAKGAATASQTAAEALAALNTARGAESTNLTNEQNSIQDIVNQYNQSVGVINPVVQTITQAISDFFANNPNVQMPKSGDPLADIKNLTSIVMPDLATYASPEDYAQIAALTQLGDTNVGNLPISSATSNLAQTFKVPTALQDAIGKAPGVETALQNELSGIGGQLNAAVKPYQDLTASESSRADAFSQVQVLQGQIPTLKQNVKEAQMELATPQKGSNLQTLQAQLDAATKALNDAQTKVATLQSSPGYSADSYWPQISQLANSLQWVNGTETSYQQLVDAINGQLGKLGQVGVPTLSYGPGAMAPVAAGGAPIGVNQAAKLAATGTQVGTPIAAGLGGGEAALSAETAAEAAAGNLGEGLATSGAPGAEATAQNLAGLQAGANALGPAALAAYGTSNIIHNASKDPIKAGLGTLANMGISLATLSLPPQIFASIGKDINKVINSIGDFFGGLF